MKNALKGSIDQLTKNCVLMGVRQAFIKIQSPRNASTVRRIISLSTRQLRSVANAVRSAPNAKGKANSTVLSALGLSN